MRRLGSARASRAGFGAPPKRTFSREKINQHEGEKVRDGEAPSPAREARALPECESPRSKLTAIENDLTADDGHDAPSLAESPAREFS